MVGLYALFIFFIWVFIAGWVTRKLTSWILRVKPMKGVWKASVYIALFPIVFLIPVSDELIGKYQLDRLCEANSSVKLKVSHVQGRVALEGYRHKNILEGTAVPISHWHVKYLDVATGEIIAESDSYMAGKGNFTRIVDAANMSAGPIAMGGKDACFGPTPSEIKSQFGFTLLDCPSWEKICFQ